jgi:hypothetical protein
MIAVKESGNYDLCTSCSSMHDVKNLEIGGEDSLKLVLTLCAECRSNLILLLGTGGVTECHE